MPIKGLKGGIGTKALGYGLGSGADPVDEHYNQTVLLLHGNGTEGASDSVNLGTTESKAFLDASSSEHSITINGNTKGNNFSPYYYADGYWSVRFKETTGSITIPDSTDFSFGSNNFSIGVWVFRTDDNASTEHGIAHTGGGSYTSWLLTTKKFWATTSGSSWDITVNYSSDIPLNQWVYLQVNRVGNVYTAYHNGSSVGTTTVSGGLYDNSDSFQIGARGGTTEFNGFLSNLVITNGGNLSGTSVPTAPTTTDSNTKLLCLQSNRFLDNSATGHVLTPSGTGTNAPEISINTPFTVTKTANVGSGFFDEDEDYLQVGGANETDFDFGTNDFTVECWFYYTSDAGTGPDQHDILSKFDNSSGDRNWMMGIEDSSGDKLRIYYSYSPGNSSNYLTSTSTLRRNEWIHGAWVCNSGTLTLYLNGVAEATATRTSALHANTKPTLIGATHVSGGTVTQWFPGYIADVRIVNGTAVYTSDFTPPTSSLTAVTNTKLLTCQFEGTARNVGFTDMSLYRNELTPNGTGGVSVSNFTPFSTPEGEWSVYFDGVDDELNLTNTATIGTGNFTMEMWVYPENRSNSCLIDSRSANGATDGIIFKLNSSKFQISGNDGTTNIPLNEWTHLAVVREGTGSNETKMYVNGALDKTITFALNLTSTFFGVGVFNDGSNSGDYKGYISNLRVVNDTVYTGAFTVPSTPLTAIANTDVLICQSNRWEKDNSTNNFTVSVPQGTPAAVPFSPFAPTRQYSRDVVGGSLHIPLVNNWLRIEHTGYEDMFYWTGDFTYEGWVYFITPGDTSVFYGEGGTYNAFNMNPGTNSSFYTNSTSGTSLGAETDIGQYQWTHVALVRSGSTIKMYKNGVASTTTITNSSNLGYASQTFRLGSSVAQTFYLAFPRLSQKAVYTTNFTPPTGPWASSDMDTSTVFASNFDNPGIDNRTMKTGVAPIADARISDEQIKFGIGSIKFDGTGDYLKIPYSPLLAMDAGDFTIECFFYQLSTGAYRTIFSSTTTYNTSNQIRVSTGNSNDTLRVASGGSDLFDASSSFNNNQWYHMALVKYGSTLTLYLDGTSVGSASNSQTFITDTFQIGDTELSSTHYYFHGYIDEFRVTKGVARYTSNFTVPTKPFPDKQA